MGDNKNSVGGSRVVLQNTRELQSSTTFVSTATFRAVEAAKKDVSMQATRSNVNRVVDSFEELEVKARPAASYLTSIKARLQREGLPTSAPHVQMVVLGEADKEGLSAHGYSVLDSIKGPFGLAQGANIKVPPWKLTDTPSESRLIDTEKRLLRKGGDLESGNAILSDIANFGAELLVQRLESTALNIDAARALVPAASDKRVRLILNLSNGHNVAGAAFDMATRASEAPEGSPLYKELVRKLGPKDDPKKWEIGVEGVFATAITDALTRKPFANALESRNKVLIQKVSAARQEGILIFCAAGNEFLKGAARDGSESLLIDAVPGMIVVGATELGKRSDGSDSTVAATSSGGPSDYVTMSTIGVNVPVGLHKKAESGTSIAAPIAASVGALMVEANPNLTPDDIELILTHPSVVYDIPDTMRDGAGNLDPVAAVRMARDFKSPR